MLHIPEHQVLTTAICCAISGTVAFAVGVWSRIVQQRHKDREMVNRILEPTQQPVRKLSIVRTKGVR